MLRFRTRIIFLFCITLCACTTPPKMLEDKSEKGEIGFRFQPPQSAGWYLHSPPGFNGYAYAKQIDGLELRSAKHSVIFAAQYGFIDVGTKNPEETLAKIRAEKKRQLLGTRFTVKRNHSEFSTFHGARCLTFDSLVFDKSAKQDMELTGMFCLHPNDILIYLTVKDTTPLERQSTWVKKAKNSLKV
jgi:hypothetical protein